MQSATDRDLDGIAAKKEREAAPEFVCEDVTGTYAHDPEALKEARRTRRTTAERLEHLEEKYDRLVTKVIDSRTKIVVAIASAVGVLAGYLLSGCL